MMGSRSGSRHHVISLELPGLGTLLMPLRKALSRIDRARKSWKFDGELEVLSWLPYTEERNDFLSCLFSIVIPCKRTLRRQYPCQM